MICSLSQSFSQCPGHRFNFGSSKNGTEIYDLWHRDMADQGTVLGVALDACAVLVMISAIL